MALCSEGGKIGYMEAKGGNYCISMDGHMGFMNLILISTFAFLHLFSPHELRIPPLLCAFSNRAAILYVIPHNQEWMVKLEGDGKEYGRVYFFTTSVVL